MSAYTRLYTSMLDCCDRGIGYAFGYTVAMLALGAGFCVNLLSAINVLWALRLLQAPYGHGGSVHPDHYVVALLYGILIANTIVARVRCNTDRHLPAMEAPADRRLGPVYVLGSAVVFMLTLAWGLWANH